jgi:hypothetical protein
MSPVAQPISPVDPVSEIVRQEVIALLSDLRDRMPASDDFRLGMDLVEIAQDTQDPATPEDEQDLVRISPAVPL